MEIAGIQQYLHTAAATTPLHGGLLPYSIVGDATPVKTEAAKCQYLNAPSPFKVLEQAGMGGVGDLRPVLHPPLLDDASSSAAQVNAICQRYKLGDDICQLFVAKALDPLNCLFEINDEKLEELNRVSDFAFVTDIRLAVKKMLSEKESTVRVITSKEEHETSADGGDGHGGFRWFCRGGTGGAGGTSGVLGTEGTGGEEEGSEQGSLDEAPQTPALYVALFRKLIARNLGGRGESNQGSVECESGKDGESPDFGCLLFSLNGEPRSLLLFRTLLPSQVPANIRQMLENEGYKSVAGLLEANDPNLWLGSSKAMVAAVSKFAARREILVRPTD